ncbi:MULTISPECIES: hypothetical protein [Sphingomonas]|uniref:Uncharacterized protein n=1 Tax=Sphingomonas paucimobilis TaxID=13689 RepID=A0A7Y2PAN4_SPHPI|nr:hypothetical protein [Sphingomonas paucimobilis]EPE62608.1 hypothetical protein L479_01004 [Exiguobacterium sp. S17]MCM3681424.1 hypothetical protein [Sphingomonas paucimobilis]NNG56499.1 hypothetical protein [Sphingomonas paucimobilis]
MTILARNRDHIATLFERDGQAYLTVVVGGVGLYEFTITVPSEDVALYLRDEDALIALARDVATRTAAYVHHRTDSAIDPV